MVKAGEVCQFDVAQEKFCVFQRKKLKPDGDVELEFINLPNLRGPLTPGRMFV